MSSRILIARSSNLAVSVEEMAEHLRRTDTEEDDAYIEGLCIAAAQAVEDFTGLALTDQTWDYFIDAFPDDGLPFYLPLPPLLEVQSIYYRDSGSAQQLYGNYLLDYGRGDRPTPGRIYLPSTGTWPTTDGFPAAVRVRFRAGYLDDSASPPASVEGEIPMLIKQCIKIYGGSMYANRESGPDKSILEMLRGYRVESSIG